MPVIEPLIDPYHSSSSYVPAGDMWGFKRIDAAYAWALSKGDLVTVAVIDSGVDFTNSDLDANRWSNERELNGLPKVDDDGNGYVDDIYGWDFVAGLPSSINNDIMGHGTYVSGIIAAEENSTGINGVAPEAQIMSLKALGYSADISDFAAAIRYAADMGARVINMSLGIPPYYDASGKVPTYTVMTRS